MKSKRATTIYIGFALVGVVLVLLLAWASNDKARAPRSAGPENESKGGAGPADDHGLLGEKSGPVTRAVQSNGDAGTASEDAGDSLADAAPTLRFLKHALAFARPKRVPHVLVDTQGPHFAVIVHREGGPSPKVTVLDRRGRIDTVIEAAEAHRVPTELRLSKADGAVTYFELRGLTRMPNIPDRPYRGQIQVTVGARKTLYAFELAHRVQSPGVSFGLNGQDQQWHVNFNADLFGLDGIRSVSIRLFRGREELSVEFTEFVINGLPIADIIGKRAWIDEGSMWASGVAPREWEHARDLMAIFEVESMDHRRFTATWRATDRDG